MSVRMNGAEPDEIYLGNLGSNVGMIMDSYEQLEHGIAPLFNDVQQQYDVRLESTVESLLLNGGRVSGVRVRDGDGTAFELNGPGVILATPANTSAILAEGASPHLAEHLRKIAYYPVTVIIAEYDRPVFTTRTRAFTFGDDMVVSNAGAYGINDLNLVRYTFSGRTARRSLNQATSEQLLEVGEAALANHAPLDHRWRRRFEARSFCPGLCAYAPHHGRCLDNIVSELKNIPGLYLSGDYLRGASIEACFRAASDCVAGLAQASN